MKRLLFSFLILISFVFSAAAQKPAVAKTDAVEANLRKNITYLASDKLEGRRTGEAGATAAANYISGQFAALKLKPGFRSKGRAASFLQPFPYVTGVEMAKAGNEFTPEVTQRDGKPIKVSNLIPAKPVGFSPNGNVANANIVFAGFGIVSTEPKFDDYNPEGIETDVRGKVVILFDGTPDNDNPHSAFARFDARTKALIAKDKGAVGILLISRETKFEDDGLTQLKYDQTSGEAALPTFVISRNTAENILGIKSDGLGFLEKLVASKIDPNAQPHISLGNVAAAVSFKVNLVKKQAAAYNVIGILPGTDPKLKGEAIVIGAHYDHLGHGGQGSLAASSTEIHHGADDNASGTAAIIELARRLAAAKKNKRTIIFMSFSGEEEGLIGSKFYVNNPIWPLEKTIAMINLDMVGRLNNGKLDVGGIGTASEFKQLVEQINSVTGPPSPDQMLRGVVKENLSKKGITGVTVIVKDFEVTLEGNVRKDQLAPIMLATSEAQPRKIINSLNRGSISKGSDPDTFVGNEPFALQLNEDGFGPSDHSSFYGKKVPVLFFFTGTHVDYHKPSDTADKINYAGESKVISYVAAIALAIDQNLQRPTYTVAKSSGTGGGRSGFNISLGTIPSYGDTTDGMLIDGVRDNSPASRAGLKAGDKVVRLNGKEVRNATDYTFVLGTMKAGEEYEMEIVRGTEPMKLKIIPVKRP